MGGHRPVVDLQHVAVKPQRSVTIVRAMPNLRLPSQPQRERHCSFTDIKTLCLLATAKIGQTYKETDRIKFIICFSWIT